MSTPLNIVYINSHDTGRYVQPYGYAVPTPAIQALTEDGVIRLIRFGWDMFPLRLVRGSTVPMTSP